MHRITLRTHAHYSRGEVLAALDWAGLDGPSPRQTKGHSGGVVWSEAARTHAFLVTLRKTERDCSPTTMYRDYALSPTLFHW